MGNVAVRVAGAALVLVCWGCGEVTPALHDPGCEPRCDEHAVCTDDATCACEPGYAGDGASCHEIWQPVMAGVAPLFAGSGGWMPNVAVVGHGVYLGREISNVGEPEAFAALDTSTLAFSTPLTLPGDAATQGSDFCACGFGAVFIGGDTELYLLGNTGRRYSLANDAWTDAVGYAGHSRGEAGGAWVTSEQAAYLFGGRHIDNKPNDEIGRYEPATEGFSSVGVSPWALDRAVATTVDGDIYVYGSVRSPENQDVPHFGRYDVAGATWVDLPTPAEQPSGGSNDSTMGVNDGQVFLAEGGMVWFFDPIANTWGPPVEPPSTQAVTGAVVVGTPDGVFLIQADSDVSTGVYRYAP